MNRICLRCEKEIGPERPFSKYCREACRTQQNYRDSNRRHMAYMETRRERRRKWLSFYKQKKGCAECGYSKYPEALHFDHLDQTSKHKEVSSMFGYSLKNLMAEVRKCRVLCANCHAHHSKKQQNKGFYDPATGLRKCE